MILPWFFSDVVMPQAMDRYRPAILKPSAEAVVTPIGAFQDLPLRKDALVLEGLLVFYQSIDERFKALWQAFLPRFWADTAERYKGTGRGKWISQHVKDGVIEYRLSPTGLRAAVLAWSTWDMAEAPQDLACTRDGDRALCSLLVDTSYVLSYKSVSVDDVVFSIAKPGKKGMWQSWALVNKAADDDGIYFVHIKGIYTHEDAHQEAHVLLKVEWHKCGVSAGIGAAARNPCPPWDPNLQAPVFGERKWKGPILLSAGLVTPVHVTVLPHPTLQHQLVALPCTRDPKFLMQAGFAHPPQ
jgi:hypothetical protein